MFPDEVRRFVLDGVVNSRDYYENFWDYGFQAMDHTNRVGTKCTSHPYPSNLQIEPLILLPRLSTASSRSASPPGRTAAPSPRPTRLSPRSTPA